MHLGALLVSRVVCPTQRKVKYATKRLAIRVAIKSSQRRGVALRVYYHAACGSYHLTSTPKIDIHTNEEGAA